MSKIKILVVEDERIIAMDIKNSLEKMGYEVPAIAGSGEVALEKFREFQPDLVLMDIMLKGKLDGVETAEKIRCYHCPVIFLTAHTDIVTLERAKATEPFGYIVKPFEERDLYTTVEIALLRAKAEAEIFNALEKEKELNELKSRFISMVSHEFRTPLSTILFSAGLLESYGTRWTEEKKLTHLQRIQTAVHQMTQLLEDVLLIGKAEANKIEFQPSALDLEKFCSEITEEMQLTDGHQHQLKFKCDRWSKQIVYLDEKLLRHIVSNLLSNAIKYSPIGSDILFELGLIEQEIYLKFQDWGIGIPVEDRSRLFELFHRATNVGTISGTGLGLAIAKRAVDLHGGQITVESEVGVGTVFTVTLPSK